MKISSAIFSLPNIDQPEQCGPAWYDDDYEIGYFPFLEFPVVLLPELDGVHSPEECELKRCDRCHTSRPLYLFKSRPSHVERTYCNFCIASKITKEESRAKTRERINRYNRTDINFKLATRLRTRLYEAMKGRNRSGSAVRDLGCSVEEFKQHLQSLFEPGMHWQNYGCKMNQWSIDHIMPLSKFDLTDRQHLLLACNFYNMQPMWHRENLSKNNRVSF